MAGFFVAALLLRATLARKLPLTMLTPVVIALLVTLLVVPGMWGGMRGLDNVREGLVLAPGINEREKCLVDGGHPEAIGLSRFVIKQVPPTGRVVVQGSVPQVCLQLTLLPRVLVGQDEPHSYALYVGKIPASVRARLRAEEGADPASRTTIPYESTAVLVREG